MLGNFQKKDTLVVASHRTVLTSLHPFDISIEIETVGADGLWIAWLISS
jgi:hypothetical protein